MRRHPRDRGRGFVAGGVVFCPLELVGEIRKTSRARRSIVGKLGAILGGPSCALIRLSVDGAERCIAQAQRIAADRARTAAGFGPGVASPGTGPPKIAPRRAPDRAPSS